MAQIRAKRNARQAARKKRAKQQSGGGSRFAQLGCTRGELERSPVHAAYVGDSVFTIGIGPAIIARNLPDGRIAAGIFLVDAYCLGIKDAFLMVQSSFEFEDIIETKFDTEDLKPVEPAYARKLVDDSIAYARDLGFEPHADFREASVVLGGIDPGECTEEFTFGHNGKPFYVSGPKDSEAKSRRIVAHLKSRCGPDGVKLLVGDDDPSVTDSFGPDLRLIEEDEEDEEASEDEK